MSKTHMPVLKQDKPKTENSQKSYGYFLLFVALLTILFSGRQSAKLPRFILQAIRLIPMSDLSSKADSTSETSTLALSRKMCRNAC